MRRNQVKMHDHIISLIQQKQAEKEDRVLMIEMLTEIRDDIRMRVSNYN